MGQAIKKMVSLTTREVKSFNLESRAEKVISKDKPTPAPKHPSTIKELERLKEENVSTDYLYKKDEQLDSFLKKVYVTTPDPAPPLERKINPDRPLPVKRPADTGITYGYSESEEAAVPEGRVSLKQALTFISNHQSDPKKYSNAAIASEYKLSLGDTSDILEYFKMCAVKINKKKVDPASLSNYERLQLKVKEMTFFNASAVMKEVKAAFPGTFPETEEKSGEKEKEEKSVVPDSPKKPSPTGNLEKAKESSNSDTTSKMRNIIENKDLQTKTEENKTKTTQKRSQENG